VAHSAWIGSSRGDRRRGCGLFVFVRGWISSMRHFEGVGAATRGVGRGPKRHRGQVHRGRCHAGPSDTETRGTGVRMRESGPLAAAERAALLPDKSRVARCSGSCSRGCTLCARNEQKWAAEGAAPRHGATSRQARRQGAQGGERSVGAAESEQFVRGSSRSVAGVEQKQRQQQRQRANKR
jgi:hypothetical protein